MKMSSESRGREGELPARPLTARQWDIGLLVTRGLSNPEIARVLGISISTAKKHVRDLFERIDASSRAELAARLVGLGLVSAGPVAPTGSSGR
jgi:DNA-binding NarL/FixJ family response regulator